MSDTILITGGAGFIGSSLARAATRRGQQVRVIDDMSTGRRENLEGVDGVSLIEASILDTNALADAIRGCRTVFHMAGQVSVERSLDEPAITHAVNATGSLRVFEEARAGGVERVVYSASCAAYGQTTALPIYEDTPLCPESPYAASKLVGELYGSAWSASTALMIFARALIAVQGALSRWPGSPRTRRRRCAPAAP